MPERAIWLGTVLVLFVVFVIGLHVIKGILWDARERHRSESESDYSKPPGSQGTPGQDIPGRTEPSESVAPADPAVVRCRNCGTENRCEYTYCQACTNRL